MSTTPGGRKVRAWQVLATLLLVQSAFASYSKYHVLKERSLAAGSVHIVAKKAITLGHYIPFIGALLLVDNSVDVELSCTNQTVVLNVDLLEDFPFEDVLVRQDGDVLRVEDSSGRAYACFLERK